MILWLDHLIFGNGRGLKSPYWDNVYFWLDGQLYTFFGGFGAQLHSFQWRMPQFRERRILCGREFQVFNAQRTWGRVRVSWGMIPPTSDYADIESLRKDLCDARGNDAALEGK